VHEVPPVMKCGPAGERRIAQHILEMPRNDSMDIGGRACRRTAPAELGGPSLTSSQVLGQHTGLVLGRAGARREFAARSLLASGRDTEVVEVVVQRGVDEVLAAEVFLLAADHEPSPGVGLEPDNDMAGHMFAGNARHEVRVTGDLKPMAPQNPGGRSGPRRFGRSSGTLPKS
jgi:hypothetical protein